MVRRWMFGFLCGSAIIAATSPLFVRSYVPRTDQPTRGVAALTPGSNYRWRSEGFATTKIGPLGMPGQPNTAPLRPGGTRIALWGDSQAEGVCVDDSNKISSLTGQLSSGNLFCLPFARSGDNCNDWIAQIESLEGLNDDLSIDLHVFLVAELSDWSVPSAPPSVSIDPAFNRLSEVAPAFAIQTARNLLLDKNSNQLRSLRFRPGPIRKQSVSDPGANSRQRDEDRIDLERQLERLRSVTTRKCVFLYAPLFPSIENGKIVFDDPDDDLFQLFKEIGSSKGFEIVDLRLSMQTTVRNGVWPRGFQNGQFGVGHYNAKGNQIIAQQLVDQIRNSNSED